MAKKEELDFNEAIEFCEESLAYLLDKGYILSSREAMRYPNKVLDFILHKPDKENIDWNDIKDDVIPFLFRLNSEYYLSNTLRSSNPIKIIYNLKKEKKDTSNDSFLVSWSSLAINTSGKVSKAFTINNLDKTKIFKDLSIISIEFTIRSKIF